MHFYPLVYLAEWVPEPKVAAVPRGLEQYQGSVRGASALPEATNHSGTCSPISAHPQSFFGASHVPGHGGWAGDPRWLPVMMAMMVKVAATVLLALFMEHILWTGLGWGVAQALSLTHSTREVTVGLEWGSGGQIEAVRRALGWWWQHGAQEGHGASWGASRGLTSSLLILPCALKGVGQGSLSQASLLGKTQIPKEPRDLASRRGCTGGLGSRESWGGVLDTSISGPHGWETLTVFQGGVGPLLSASFSLWTAQAEVGTGPDGQGSQNESQLLKLWVLVLIHVAGGKDPHVTLVCSYLAYISISFMVSLLSSQQISKIQLRGSGEAPLKDNHDSKR